MKTLAVLFVLLPSICLARGHGGHGHCSPPPSHTPTPSTNPSGGKSPSVAAPVGMGSECERGVQGRCKK
jgi:hypothetical protein